MSEIYETHQVEWYSEQFDVNLTGVIGRVFTRGNTSKLFRVMPDKKVGHASVRVTNGNAVCQGRHCENKWRCEHVRAVNALLG